jgi:glycosyltransferase involved in cell wall biosynthesis
MIRGCYDITLSYLPTPNFYNILARRMLLHGPRIVVAERSTPDRSTRQERAIRHLYRLADFIVCNSNHVREGLQNLYPHLKNRMSTIYNGLDTNLFCPPKVEPSDTPLRLISVGRVLTYKNGLCLIEALAILRDRFGIRPQISWVGEHLDKSVPEHHAYLLEMQRVLEENQLRDQWHWLHVQTNIPKLLQQHHALVHASYREGLPNAVCEALACGRPVIVSNTLDHPYLVKNGVNGYLFDFHDPEDLARCIKMLADLSPEARHQMGQEARSFAVKELSLEHLIDNYEKLFWHLTNSLAVS